MTDYARTIRCPECSIQIHGARKDQTYCGATCRKRASRALKATKARDDAEAALLAEEELAEAEANANAAYYTATGMPRRPVGPVYADEVTFYDPPTEKPSQWLRSRLNLPPATPANPGWTNRAE